MEKVKIAVIPVAGYGTRFLPYTKAIPKPMLPIVNRPAIEIIAEEVAKSGIEEIVFVVGYKKDIIENHFGEAIELEEVLEKSNNIACLNSIKYPQTIAKMHFVVQEAQLGTAHAILSAEKYVNGRPFAVLFGDDVMYNENNPVISQLVQVYEARGKTIVGVKRVPLKDVPKYASVEYDEQNGKEFRITKITEKPPIEEAKSNLAPLGRYVCAPSMMDVMRNLSPGLNGEYQFTDALDIEGKTVGAYAYEFDGVRYDMGDRLGFLKANVEFALRDESIKDEFKSYLKELVKD